MKVHLGAFDQSVAGWINTDITFHMFIARVPGLAYLMGRFGLLSAQRVKQHRDGIFSQLRYANVAKRLPFAENSVGSIYSSHMLEHLDPETGRRCMAECFRVLKRNGVLRIAVPDLDALIRLYDPEYPERMLVPFFELQKGYKNRHWWHYTDQSLQRALREVGFSDVYRCQYREGRCEDVEKVDCRPDSLFVEAIKW